VTKTSKPTLIHSHLPVRCQSRLEPQLISWPKIIKKENALFLPRHALPDRWKAPHHEISHIHAEAYPRESRDGPLALVTSAARGGVS
jgi:hypothetical protein